jgi:uncharacterized secreted protein with C-terminal beta-propeller domain
MDEHEEHFRVATTTGYVWRNGNGSAKNHIYVMDMDMNITGSIKDIAPTEMIYSTRFMGNRAYVVTFKKVDPFFVIDLSDPKEPKILGELKIPGYSDYLHPYDENHVIGLGKETHDMGTFAWFQGVKLSLFDVTDVENPKELSKFVIGDRGTYSPAQSDPHTFLFSKKNNLLVIPIRLYEINRTQNPNPSPSTHGEFTWEGAYVFNISKEGGINLKGRITHSDDEQVQPTYYYNYGSGNSIKRSFYIKDVLYTCSNNKLKMNSMSDLTEINEVELPGSSNYEWIFISTPIQMVNP